MELREIEIDGTRTPTSHRLRDTLRRFMDDADEPGMPGREVLEPMLAAIVDALADLEDSATTAARSPSDDDTVR
ncbi:hypothetical protein [Isoptericola sp. NPDC057191]|uniref:hypothetical protein n=1 Tax=Isoptericola sp. NPDC057191 TaxID=3346041 RepID=UPI003642D5EE